MLSLSPAEIGGWRSHFQRHPPDAVERLLSMLIRLQCADPQPVDSTIRPWAYNAREAAEQRARAEGERRVKAERKADLDISRIM